MRVGPSTPTVPTCSPSITTGATTTEQAGERLDAVLGADRHRQAAAEDVAHQRHEHVLLLQRAQHAAHRVDRVERLGHRRRAADEHRLRRRSAAARPGPSAHSRSTAASPLVRHRRARVERLADEAALQVGGRRGQAGVGRVGGKLERRVVDRAVGHHRDDGGVVSRQPDELDRANHAPARRSARRPRRHARSSGPAGWWSGGAAPRSGRGRCRRTRRPGGVEASSS